MRYLSDTHLLLWAARSPDKLSARAKAIFKDQKTEIFFSTVSIWETAIKYGRGKQDFTLPPATLRNVLIAMGFTELLITSEQVMGVASLAHHHRDPFDRLLVAQAVTEGVTLVTADKTLSLYVNTLLV